MPTLSVCMIVRDEAVMLPEFLRRIGFGPKAHGVQRRLCDELCVVDTGSSDGTQALLRQAGATVVEKTWQDDFADARNQSLKLASSDFVLVLDADEWVSPAFVDEVHALLKNPRLGAATMRLCSTLPHGHRTRADMLRLFKNFDTVAFTHRIHEQITSSVNEALLQHDLEMFALDTEVEHLGYDREICLLRDKKNRDSRLLRLCIDEDPDDAYSWFKLLEQGHIWNDDALVAFAMRGARDVLQRNEVPEFGAPQFVGEMVSLLVNVEHPNDAKKQLEAMAPFVERLQDSPSFTLHWASQLERASRNDEARKAYTACLSHSEAARNVQLTNVRPRLGLARLALTQNLWDEAINHIDEALRIAPRDPEALLALATLSRLMGGADAAQEVAQAHQEVYGESAELHAAWGEAALFAKDYGAAAKSLETAVKLAPHHAYDRLLHKALAQGAPV